MIKMYSYDGKEKKYVIHLTPPPPWGILPSSDELMRIGVSNYKEMLDHFVACPKLQKLQKPIIEK